MARKPKSKIKPLPFGHKLVLNQWIVSLFGFDPLKDHKDGKRTLRPVQPLAKTVKDAPEGMTAENLHHFYKALDVHLQAGAQITRADLLRYEHNIVSHTLAINEKRDRPIVWKYYQWLSLLFAEIYLDRFFADRAALLDSLNAYVESFNEYWTDEGYETGITPYELDDLNKLCLQNATGSGKTLLMHVNFLQFRHYASKSPLKHDLTRTVLITPNEQLSLQHAREMKGSNIVASRLLTDSGDLLSSGKNGLRQVDFTEVTKLGDTDGPNVIATRNLGDQNLLLVDEAHRGMGSQEERGWFRSRARLSEKGFVFEYSATLKEAVTAAKRSDIEASYAKTILFDYSYRYFYEDGYGKDYRIFNLPRTFSQLEFSYLTACLLSFYQQLKLYEDKQTLYSPYNIEKPLWVFVGSSVTKATGSKAEKATVSDVGKILAFIAKFLKSEGTSAAEIERILTGKAQETGLLDENGGDIFAGGFVYLQQLMRREGWKPGDLFRDILEKLFQNRAGGELLIARIKGDENEIMLRVGQAEKPFGLINVGDASGLATHIAEQEFDNVAVLESEFAETMFGQINLSSSPVNLLIGSKRFVEGWDCWRVSTLGLMHVGKSEGAQIIQLFGRGVRLKGYDWSLQRSGFATPTHQPELIQYVETLNVFGIEADFMERFRKFLEEEELPRNDQKQVFTVPLTVTYDFGRRLKVLRPRKKRGDGREYDFKRDGAVPALTLVPEKIRQKGVTIDWYPRIQSLESKRDSKLGTKEETVFEDGHLDFLDYDDLFFRLEKFKRERTWHNLNISKSMIRTLLIDRTWYKVIVPSGKMEFSDFGNVTLWQEMAAELLQKFSEEYYNYCKAAFIEPRLELREIEAGDGSLPEADEYQLIVDASETALIKDIQNLIGEISARKAGVLRAGDLKGCLFGTHLYEPVLHAAKGSRIQIAPVSLNESEFQFLDDMRLFIEKDQARLAAEGIELFLLRNESRGRGVGFFEAGNFYPDFLLWLVKDGRQHLAFVEPHGLQHEGPGHKKIEFHQVIKGIQARLASDNVILNSFIVTPTRFGKLNWGKTIHELEDMHVLFMEDRKDTYVAWIINRMAA
ncbi:DEAD/DEAH box helicase family protein [Oceanicella actignis]|uniref:Type III restriction enzyme, res subunit n=1 Tax=Oceanicella actignis TaxID=1189325 RepID=A0A1M7TPH7_9RHOB|nr:DEAD/DEAH box helicase family protein [Oceanicella actignis]SET73865.1 Type III restriction enzyme, res subunit [Oceanicella actignis]SHN72642.1 Type III restriction enzyme, res subunit [Oceanicella actignis]